MIYALSWVVVRFLLRVLLRMRVEGAENVPRSGPVIVASNHVSYLDPPVLGTAVWRPGAFMAKEELFRPGLVGWFLRQLGAFPVKRGAVDRAALRQALEALARGRALYIFPEGTRSETGELREPELGVGMIAVRSGAPVVPAYIEGTERALPRGGGFRLAPVRVTYGPPLRFDVPDGRRPGRDEYEAAARRIMAAIAELRDRSRAGRKV